MVSAKMQHIEVGDTVTLIVGGPEMLVELIDEENIVYCVWFNQQRDLQKDRFLVDSLNVISKGSKN